MKTKKGKVVFKNVVFEIGEAIGDPTRAPPYLWEYCLQFKRLETRDRRLKVQARKFVTLVRQGFRVHAAFTDNIDQSLIIRLKKSS